MYVCMYVCVYVYTYVRMCVCIYVHTYVCSVNLLCPHLFHLLDHQCHVRTYVCMYVCEDMKVWELVYVCSLTSASKEGVCVSSSSCVEQSDKWPWPCSELGESGWRDTGDSGQCCMGCVCHCPLLCMRLLHVSWCMRPATVSPVQVRELG